MPASNTYEPIATVILTNATNSVGFGSIPQTYTDLILIISAASTVAQDPIIRLNSDSGTNYSYTTLTGNGSSASSARATSQLECLKTILVQIQLP